MPPLPWERAELTVTPHRPLLSLQRFLGDYGLQWVGEPMDQEDLVDSTDSKDGRRDWMTARKFWKLGRLVPSPSYKGNSPTASFWPAAVCPEAISFVPLPPSTRYPETSSTLPLTGQEGKASASITDHLICSHFLLLVLP